VQADSLLDLAKIQSRGDEMKNLTVLFLILVLSVATLALDGKKTAYVGGTIAGLKEGTEGKSSAMDETKFVFEHKKGKLEIPYSTIEELEYGQKAGRRVAASIITGSPWLLFSKKRKHYLTINYKDDAGKTQAAVFELGKDVIRTMLSSLEARTGKEIQYQDEEAKKNSKGN
jgi:hypothetical protein